MTEQVTTAELQALRDELVHGRRRDEVVVQRFEAFASWLATAPGGKSPAGTIRCSEKHQGGRPKLAEYRSTPFGILFVSRIEWVPSDQLQLRPWMRRQLIVSSDEVTRDLLLTDDAYATEALDHWREWGQGREADGPRWLSSMSAMEIRDVLEFEPSAPGRPELWVRCARHPAEAELLDRENLIAQLR